MPAPNEFTRKLTDALGKEAADQMTDWMHQRESETSEIRAEIRADFAEVAHRMEAGFAKINARFSDIDARFSLLDKTIDAKVAEATATHLKWSVAMWIATMAFLGAMIRMR